MTSIKADSLFVGFNGQTPVQLYSTIGTYVSDVGSTNDLAAIPVTGAYFTVLPSASLTSTTVTEWNGNQVAIGSFSVNSLLEDGAPGPNNTLFLSSFDGTVFQTSYTGTVLESWNTGFTHVGVAFDGTFVYTTEGDTGSNLDKWTTSGASAGSIATPLSSLYGLGYQSSTGDFWAGSTDYVYQLDGSGNIVNTLNLTGDSRTPNGAVHDGLEVGDLPSGVPTVSSAPEPGSFALLGLGTLLILGACQSKTKRVFRQVMAIIGGAGCCFAAVSVQTTPSASSAPVGSTIVWTATASDSVLPGATLAYQYSVGSAPNALRVVRDYSSDATFAWTPIDNEGTFWVQTNVRSSSGGAGTTVVPYTVTSRITGAADVVTPTAHPLVAFYSMPPCAVGRQARVRFKGPGDTIWQTTSFKACNGTTSVNFYIAGMRASTAYTLQHDLYMGPFDSPGPLLTFATGALPSTYTLSTISINVPSPSPNNTAYPVVLYSTPPVNPFAVDPQGRVIWYLAGFTGTGGYVTRPVPGGTFLSVSDSSSGAVDNRALVREWDLAGNVVRETGTTAINPQLHALGTDNVNGFSHEVNRLPNGDTALIATVERLANQGAGVVDVVGDMVIVLDTNFQVKWFWNSFDHLDITRAALLGEQCFGMSAGCGPVLNPNYSVANDWTHANSVAPALDGNLIVSLRHQDWVLKLNYNNGAGNGSILWTLGNGGNFQPISQSTYPFFTHQHDVTFDAKGDLTLFDNGNTRVVQYGGVSRGQAWHLDETNLKATVVFDQNLPAYSAATGSAQMLSNGDYEFYSGFLNNDTQSATDELAPTGALQFEQFLPQRPGYRSFRMRSLYSEY